MNLNQVARFVAVGLINTCTGLLIIYALKFFAGFGDVEANIIGYAVGMFVSFALNRRWTFEYPGDYWASGFRFIATMVMGYSLNLLTVLAGLHVFGLNSYVAQLLGVPVFTLTSFLLCKYWVFRTDLKTAHSGPQRP